jgi:type VI secretion system protein ImpJ
MKTNPVMWHEGMFLQPQHFQQQDRYWETCLNGLSNCLCPFFWGFVELTIDLSFLSLGKIGIKKARGIFPDGTLFDMPERDLLPTILSLPDNLSNERVYLVVPLQMNESGSNDRYHIQHEKVIDTITETHEIAEVPLGFLNCQLLLESKIPDDFVGLPIAHIQSSDSNHRIVFDENFITPCLDIRMAPKLKMRMAEILGLLKERMGCLSKRLMGVQQTMMAKLNDRFLLQTCHKYMPVLSHLNDRSIVHPEILFIQFIQLLGELSTGLCDKEPGDEHFIYQHDDLFNTFDSVLRSLKTILIKVDEDNVMLIRLKEKTKGLWVGLCQDKRFFEKSRWILRGYSKDKAGLEKWFCVHTKIAPVEEIHTLVKRALSGISMKMLNRVPGWVPYDEEWIYFELDSNHRLWKRMQMSTGIALHVGQVFSDLNLELWVMNDEKFHG